MARSLNTHEKARCVLSKRGLTDLLGQTKSLWEARKQRRIDDSAAPSNVQTGSVTPALIPPNAAYANGLGGDAETFLGSVASESTIAPSTGQGDVTEEPPVQMIEKNTPLSIRRPWRQIRLPAHYLENTMVSSALCITDNVEAGTWWTSAANAFSLWRCYYGRQLPSHDAERNADFQDTNEPPEFEAVSINPQIPALGPFPSLSAFWFADWWWNGGNEKSAQELQKLLTLFTTEGFSFQDAFTTDWKATIKVFDADEDEGNTDNSEQSWFDDANWILTPITIPHRRIISVIEEKIRNVKHGHFHYQPYELMWSPPSGSELEDEQLDLCVQGELYNSPALCKHIAYLESLSDNFKDGLRKRNGRKAVPKDLLRQCVREIFHAQWDIILGDPELREAMEHGIVLLCRDAVKRCFFPTCFTYSADYPEKARIATIKQNGKFPCPNCLTPKGALQNMGTAEDIEFRINNPRLDDEENRAMISRALKKVEDGYAITGDLVDIHIKSRSLLTVKNAFSSNLAPFGYDIFQSLVVDPLHEFEIGVWKGLYIHLLRLLRAFGKSDLIPRHRLTKLIFSPFFTRIAEQPRYRLISSFGRDTIRKFSRNASECKRRAARDYEDLLQCSIPVFDGLLPSPHNEIVKELLFLLCQWHALAKLRLHHDITLEFLESTTTRLASQFRRFEVQTCKCVEIRELPHEAELRERQAAKKPFKDSQEDSSKANPASTSSGATTQSPRERHKKRFNLCTPKYHALGHYAWSI
ncbi:hypothetical protein BKA70DRAFT_1435826 [Coprinopsis sp. MPI-PUGE-AT-0042]|nr:hypothetical protein BKA70DRAFT_1435826 [Coprinopsis sp. MPI-PUGE-AT-0042]